EQSLQPLMLGALAAIRMPRSRAHVTPAHIASACGGFTEGASISTCEDEGITTPCVALHLAPLTRSPWKSPRPMLCGRSRTSHSDAMGDAARYATSQPCSCDYGET